MREGRMLRNRLGLAVLGACLAGTGLFFCVVLWSGYVTAKRFHDWVECPALVIASSIESRAVPGAVNEQRYRASVRYRYTYESREWVSDRVRWKDKWSRDRTKAERMVARYGLGTSPRCYVNPRAPSEAILERETLAAGYTLWFPGLFVLGGAGMLWAAWRGGRSGSMK